jgi:hypothetical protein
VVESPTAQAATSAARVAINTWRCVWRIVALMSLAQGVPFDDDPTADVVVGLAGRIEQLVPRGDERRVEVEAGLDRAGELPTRR